MLGIRELRGELATYVRRAATGEAAVITVNGAPVAVLGPVTLLTDDTAPARARDQAEAHLASLVASGAVIPARRTDGRLPDQTVPVWGNVRLDRLLREVRG